MQAREVSKVVTLTPATIRSGAVVSRVRRFLEEIERREEKPVTCNPVPCNPVTCNPLDDRLAEAREDLSELDGRLRELGDLFQGLDLALPSRYLERARELVIRGPGGSLGAEDGRGPWADSMGDD